jgi:hypothetical protein
VRGRFLQEGLSHADIITGQEFDRPIANVPGKWIINSAIAMGQQLMPSSDFGDLDNPYMLTPLICCGSLSLAEAEEDCTLAGTPAALFPPQSFPPLSRSLSAPAWQSGYRHSKPGASAKIARLDEYVHFVSHPMHS